MINDNQLEAKQQCDNAAKDEAKVLDMNGLKVVWEDFNNSAKIAAKKQAKINRIRIAAPIIATAVIALTFFVPIDYEVSNIFRMILYIIVIILCVIMFAIVFRNNSKMKDDEEARKQLFRSKYVCPSCGQFMGEIPYEQLGDTYKSCPNCRNKFEW